MTAGSETNALREGFRQSEEELRARADEERAQAARELNGRIAAGDDDPGLLIRFSKLLPAGDRLRLLWEACATEGPSRRGSRDIHVAYVKALWKFNHAEESIGAAEDALRVFPADPWFELKRALTLPMVYEEPGDRYRWRARFAKELAELPGRIRLETAQQRAAALEAIGRHANFILAYQMENDRELQRQYGALIRRVLAATHPEFLEAVPMPPLAPGEKMRVGYISAHFNRHSVAKSHNGWIVERNRADAETFAYQIRGAVEWSADGVRAASDHCREVWSDFASACAEIRRDRLHAAVFLDVGMEPLMTLLVEARLAPVQCVTWGHPVTTGSANMDYYLSSDLMEAPDGDEQYTEKLIRLPGIGVFYRKPLIPKALLDTRRARFGLRAESVVYLCCQSTFKYLPEHDDVFARIAGRQPEAQFVFLAFNPEVGERFRRRLRRAFEEAGRDFDRHCTILQQLGVPDYAAVNLMSDVFLDSMDWSGFNTTMEAVACRLPVVTLPGASMRGRHSYAILTQLGVTETIARDKEEFVEIALRLGRDAELRRGIARRMAENESRIYSDRRSVDGVGQFLEQEVRRRLG